MKPLSDFLQILLSLPGWLGYASCFVLVALVLQSLKLFGAIWSLGIIALKWVRRVAICPSLLNAVIVAGLALPLYALRFPVSDGLQWFEQRYLSPLVFVPDTSSAMTAVYEMELAKYCSPHECEVIRKRTQEIAAKVGSTPLAIYEVAYSECGMNPFVIRKDGVAAGWIQFTRAGLNGSGVSLDEVKKSCQERNVERVMDLTEWYLLDRAKNKLMPRSCDIYTCVFAPGFVGADDDQALYSTRSGDAYYLNAGLDGYYLQQVGDRELIMQSRKARDGRITINDLKLALAAKKAALVGRYNEKGI